MGRFLLAWWRDERAAVAIEMGLIMPLMLIMMMGATDVGTGVIISEKVINSAQTVGDLLGREVAASTTAINDSIAAGQLAIMPYDTTAYGVDIASIQFEGSQKTPRVMWRETRGMTPNEGILAGAQGLGATGEGVLGVTVRYAYTPLFSGIVSGTRVLTEVSYVRARNGLFIPRI